METHSFVLVLLVVLPALVASQNSYEQLKPSAYHLKIAVPETDTSNEFQGHVELEVTLSRPISQLVLDAEQLTIANPTQDVTVVRERLKQETPVPISGVSFTDNTLIISCNNSVPNGKLKINLNFTGKFQDEMKGFAKVPFLFKGVEKYIKVTSFEPNFARRVFPCSVDPSNRANFVLEVTVGYSQMVLSNVKPTVHNISDTERVFVFSYPAMPVYQLGWAVFDQATYSRHAINTTDSKVIHTGSPRLYFNHTTWACQFTSELVGKLGAFLSKPYPLDKLEQVVVPQFFSGTSEGYGIISYSEEAILVSPSLTSSRDKQNVALTLSEGIIGQWFGDYVPMNSWKNMWLAKGLSKYLKYSFTSTLAEMSEWELIDHMVVELIQRALSLDNKNNSLTIDSQDEQTIIETAYNEATTTKAAAVISMLYNILGKDVFNTSLLYYIDAQSDPDAPAPNTGAPLDLWNNAYTAISDSQLPVDLPEGLSVSDVMDGWVTLKGHPIVLVSTNGSHFLITQAGNTTVELYIPITYIVQNSLSDVKRAWLKSDSILTIPKSSPNQWILVNVGQTGFYRVNYHETLWSQLQEQLTSNHLIIPRISRSQLIDDVFSFAMDGVLSMDFLMNFTKYLEKEVDYFPWYTALRNFQNVLNNIYGMDSYSLFQNHLLYLMDAVISTVGMNAKSTDSHTDKLRQSLVLEKACALGHVQCQRKAVSILNSWMESYFYDPDLSMALLCAGVANSSADTWWKVRQAYFESTYPTVQAHILSALSCSSDTSLINEFLTNITMSSDPPLSNKERGVFLETMASTPAGAEMILDWMITSLSSETNQTVQPEPVTASVTTPASVSNLTSTSESVNSSSDASNHLADIPPTIESSSTISNSLVEVVTPGRNKREVSELTGTLTENQIKSILNLIVPKLTTVPQGVKLERLLNETSVPLSNETRTYIQGITNGIYEKENATLQYNEKLTVWLSKNVDITTTIGTTKPTSGTGGSTSAGGTTPKPSGAPSIYSSRVVLFTSAILLSSRYYL